LTAPVSRHVLSGDGDQQVTKRLQQLYDVAICTWVLSWFALYLEIFRYHHVVPVRMVSVLRPVANAGAKPGGFVRTVVACSALAPLVFLTLSVWVRSSNRSAYIRAALMAAVSLAGALAMLGLSMVVLGMLNQILQQPPIIVDLTMREGNGGFVVLGTVLLAVGVFFRYRTTKERLRERSGES